MSLDGYCDPTAMTADDETHQHYNELLRSGDKFLYGRTTCWIALTIPRKPLISET
jgi:dihydrofolate reductase